MISYDCLIITHAKAKKKIKAKDNKGMGKILVHWTTAQERSVVLSGPRCDRQTKL